MPKHGKKHRSAESKIRLRPVSIATHGVALNITVQSYMGSLDFGITADAAALPDADRLADLLEDAMLELKTAAAALPPADANAATGKEQST